MGKITFTWEDRRMAEDRQAEIDKQVAEEEREAQVEARKATSTIKYRCLGCGYEFDEYEAIVHFANMIHSADMDACPECDSEDLEEGV